MNIMQNNIEKKLLICLITIFFAAAFAMSIIAMCSCGKLWQRIVIICLTNLWLILVGFLIGLFIGDVI